MVSIIDSIKKLGRQVRQAAAPVDTSEGSYDTAVAFIKTYLDRYSELKKSKDAAGCEAWLADYNREQKRIFDAFRVLYAVEPDYAEHLDDDLVDARDFAQVHSAAEPAADSSQAEPASRFIGALKERWSDIDLTSDVFLAGMSNVAAATADTPDQITFTMYSGRDLVWVDERAAGGSEFIGVATSKRARQPISDEDADDIAALAKARGWSKVNVHGSPDDRDRLWFAAKVAGLEVANHTPSAEALARYEAQLAGQEGMTMADTAPLSWRMVDHGAAPYNNEKDASPSYFVTVESPTGERKTVWGVDLERALAEGGASIGDLVEIEQTGSHPVTMPDGEIRTRNSWRVESAAAVNMPAAEKQPAAAPKPPRM